MPFKSLTDAEYEDIFKAAIGDSREVESSYIGDICKSLAYRRITKPKNVEDEVATASATEALTPGEGAQQKDLTPSASKTENVPHKTNKVKLFSAKEGFGEKKIIPVFKSKKTKIKDVPENQTTQKTSQDISGKYSSLEGEQTAKRRKKEQRGHQPEQAKNPGKRIEILREPRQKGNSEPTSNYGNKMGRALPIVHSKTTNENGDSDVTCFMTPGGKASPTGLDKNSSELAATTHKAKKQVNKGKIRSGTSGSANMESASKAKKTTLKSNISITKEMKLSTETNGLSDSCESTVQTATPTASRKVLAKERQLKQNVSSNTKVDSESSQLIPSQQEIPLSQPPTEFNLKKRLRWLQVRREVGVWVQCCNESCSKWRYLESTRDPQQIPRRWFCNMNADKSLASCAALQKGPSIVQELDLIENQYTAGSVVWAHLAGYPWWPAMVDDDPDVEQYYWITTLSDIPTHYNVVFFDEKSVTRAWITPKNLRPFYGDESRREYKMTVHRGIDYGKRLAVAKAQAAEALEMDFKHRLQKFSFLARFKGPFVLNTRTAFSNNSMSQSQEEFQKNDDMVQLLKEVKYGKKNSLTINDTKSPKKPRIHENISSISVDKSINEVNGNPLMNRKRKVSKIKEVKKELGLNKSSSNKCKQPSKTNNYEKILAKETTDIIPYGKAHRETESQNNEDSRRTKSSNHEEKQAQHEIPNQADVDDHETVMSEDMFGEDDSTQLEAVLEITSESPDVKQNEHSPKTQIIKPEDNCDSGYSAKMLKNLVAMVGTGDEKEYKFSINVPKEDEPEQVSVDSTQIPSSLQAVIGTGGAEETMSSTKVETGYHDQQSTSLTSTSHLDTVFGCKLECPDVLKKDNIAQCLNGRTHTSVSIDEIQEQTSSTIINNTGACSALNTGEHSNLVDGIPDVPLAEYPDDAVVPQGFSHSSRESSPDFEVEE